MVKSVVKAPVFAKKATAAVKTEEDQVVTNNTDNKDDESNKGEKNSNLNNDNVVDDDEDEDLFADADNDQTAVKVEQANNNVQVKIEQQQQQQQDKTSTEAKTESAAPVANGSPEEAKKTEAAAPSATTTIQSDTDTDKQPEALLVKEEATSASVPDSTPAFVIDRTPSEAPAPVAVPVPDSAAAVVEPSLPTVAPPDPPLPTSVPEIPRNNNINTNSGVKYGLPQGSIIPDSVENRKLLHGKVLDSLKSLPVPLVNEALTEYDDAAQIKGSSIRNHGAYLYGVIKRYVDVQLRNSGVLPMSESLTPAVNEKLSKLVSSGYCTQEDVESKVKGKLRMLSERDALIALDELSSVSSKDVRNIGSYLMGIIVKRQPGGSDSRSGGDSRRDRDYADRYNRRDKSDVSYRGGRDNRPPRERSRDRHGNDRRNDRYDRDRNLSQYGPSAQMQQGFLGQQQQQQQGPQMGMVPPPPPPNQQQMQMPGMNPYQQQQQAPFMQQNPQQQQMPYNMQQQQNNQQQFIQQNRPGMPPNNFGGQQPQMMQQQLQPPPQMMPGQPQIPQAYNQQQHPPYMMSSQQQQPNNQMMSPQQQQRQLQQQAPQFMQQQLPPQQVPPSQGNWQQQQLQQQQQGQRSLPPQQQQQGQVPIDILGLADKAASAVQGLLGSQNKFLQMPQPQGPPSVQQSYGAPPQQQQPPPFGGPPNQMQGQMPYANTGAPAPMPGYSSNNNNRGGAGTNSFQNDQNRGNRKHATSTATLNELPLMVQYAVQNLQATGAVDGPLDGGILGMIKDLPEQMALAALQKFASIDKNTMRNKTAYLAGVLRRELERIHRR